MNTEQLRILDGIDWVKWIDDALQGRFSVLSREREEETSEALTRIFKMLPIASREAFRAALVLVLEATPVLPGYAERLFDIVQVCQVAKPLGARQILARHLNDGVGRFRFVLNGMSRQLQPALVTALAKYSVDTTLVQYIFDSAREFADTAYALLCFRLLSFSSDESCYRYQKVLLPRLESTQDFDKFEVQLGSALNRTQTYAFYRWCRGSYQTVSFLSETKLARWRQAVLRVLKARAQDPYSRLAELYFRSEDWVPSAQEIAHIAALAEDADSASVRQELARLQRSKGWLFYSPESPISRGLKMKYVILSGSTTHPIREDSPLIEVLHGVSHEMDVWLGEDDRVPL